jgi:hypothetical protein
MISVTAVTWILTVIIVGSCVMPDSYSVRQFLPKSCAPLDYLLALEIPMERAFSGFSMLIG